MIDSDGPPQPDDEKPARPPRFVDIPSPVDDPDEPMPGSVRTSVWLWITAAVVAAGTLSYAILRLDDRRAELRADVLSRDPTISASNLDGVVTIFSAAAIGGLAIPAMAQVILALAMSRRHNGARITLAILGILFLPAVLVAGATLAGPGSVTSNYVQLGTVAMVVFMIGGLVTMFLPSSNSWFRDRRYRR